MQPRILIADDDDGILTALSFLLKAEGYVVEQATSPAQALRLVRNEFFQLVLMDLNYSLDTTSGEEGLKLIQSIRQHDAILPIVVMTGWGSIDIAVNTIKYGANDFIQKPWDNDQLIAILSAQIDQGRVSRSASRCDGINSEASGCNGENNDAPSHAVDINTPLFGQSPAMQQVMATIEHVAKSDVNILFTGENGTGKSMFARHLHNLSSRKEAALVCVNMGAVTESLFESEMFGHNKGAFTDAKDTRIGRFEMADGGTLFLDEIANTPLSQQAKLLRALEERRFEKVGSSDTQNVNIRLITATNCQLQHAVSSGAFRKDLLYRINTVEIALPSLRERREDILPLAHFFLAKAASTSKQPTKPLNKSAEAALLSYRWPGNVRELQHTMERAYILSQGEEIAPQDLGLTQNTTTATSAPEDSHLSTDESEHDLPPLEHIENTVIKQRYEFFDGDAVRAAKSLGLSRSAFYRRLGKLNKN